jgi:hypothetical protein
MVRKFKRKFGAPEQDWKRKQSQAAKIKAGSDTGIGVRTFKKTKQNRGSLAFPAAWLDDLLAWFSLQ